MRLNSIHGLILYLKIIGNKSWGSRTEKAPDVNHISYFHDQLKIQSQKNFYTFFVGKINFQYQKREKKLKNHRVIYPMNSQLPFLFHKKIHTYVFILY